VQAFKVSAAAFDVSSVSFFIPNVLLHIYLYVLYLGTKKNSIGTR
jgi:hypothetical protein